MKRFFMFLVVATAAVAQDENTVIRSYKADLEKVMAESKVVGINGAMGPTVKGVPYSAVEVTESTQVLADGTRIHNERQTNVWRDSEGRVRRETPEQVTIWDPTSNTSYFLDTKNQTGQKGTMNRFVMITKDGTRSAQATYTMRIDGRSSEMPPTEFGVLTDVAKAKVKLDAEQRAGKKEPGNTESLGQQMVASVPSEGTRTTMTIEAGAIGNDRPIQVVSERWYSAELQTVVMTRRTDPRTGEETFRLANVHRGEPGADLFLLPPGYQLVEPPAAVKTLTPQPARKEE